MKALSSHSPNLSRHDNVFEEITEILKHLTCYEVAHVDREGNEAAHKLTRHAKFVEDMRV